MHSLWCLYSLFVVLYTFPICLFFVSIHLILLMVRLFCHTFFLLIYHFLNQFLSKDRFLSIFIILCFLRVYLYTIYLHTQYFKSSLIALQSVHDIHSLWIFIGNFCASLKVQKGAMFLSSGPFFFFLICLIWSDGLLCFSRAL